MCPIEHFEFGKPSSPCDISRHYHDVYNQQNCTSLPDDVQVNENHTTNECGWQGISDSLCDLSIDLKGFQRTAWQATLGARAIVFTTHPCNTFVIEEPAKDQWFGGSSMPRVGQYKNVAIILYTATLSSILGGVI